MSFVHLHVHTQYSILDGMSDIGKLFDTVISAVRGASNGVIRIELNVNRYNNKTAAFYEHIGMHRDHRGDFPIEQGFYMNDYIMAVDC